jgi:hypothetical protein
VKRNKFLIVAALLAVLLVVFSACNSSDESTSTTDNQSQTNRTSQKSTDDSSETMDSLNNSSSNSSTSPHKNENKKQESIENDSNTDTDQTPTENSDLNVGDEKYKETLSQYSSEQIEYARIWLQLGPNQDIDGLYVRHIPAGTPLNPDDDTSASYPEAVIQLAGSRLVDGSVTYSSNGDGTINVYNVPLRWDGSYPAGKKFYTDIIKNKKLVHVDPGDDEKIIKLIKLLNVHY